MRQTKRSFVERIDFRTSPGNLGGAEQAERIRREGGWLGRGPSVVVTDLGIYHFDDAGEMRLDSLHPGATVEGVRDTIGWDVAIAPELAATPPPTADELRLIREELIRAAPTRASAAARGAWPQPFVKLTRNSSVPLSAIETMNPPMFGATIA